MITIAAAAATSAWAWALPVLGPIIAKAGILLAGARSWLPRGTGAAIIAAACGGVLAAILWHRVNAWWSPPPRTYTAAEIEAASLRAQNEALHAAIDASRKATAIREAAIRHLTEINETVTQEMETTRAKIRDPDAVAVPANDEWLRAWHRRGY